MLKRIPTILSLIAIAMLLWIYILVATDYPYMLDRTITPDQVREQVISATQVFKIYIIAALVVAVIVSAIEIIREFKKQKNTLK